MTNVTETTQAAMIKVQSVTFPRTIVYIDKDQIIRVHRLIWICYN